MSASDAYVSQRITFSITASDPDGDTLTYTWSQPAGMAGTFSETNAASVTWYSPEVSPGQAFTLQVSVSDGVNAPLTRTATFTLRAPKFSEVWTTTFSARCGGCHAYHGSSAAQGYANVVNANHSAGTACTNAGLTKRVVSSEKSNSLILRKVLGTQPSACGARMPPGGTLPEDEAFAIGAWISAGAPND